MNKRRKEKSFSEVKLHHQCDVQPQEPAGDVTMQALCAPVTEVEVKIG